jgi:uncharacterized protein YndB with AHSA1/START domain
MLRLAGEVTIDRPIEDVFDFMADARNEPRYNPIMRHAEKLTDGPIGVGTRFCDVSRSFGRDIKAIIELIDYERPERLAWSIHLPATAIAGVLEFTPTPEGTRARWTWDVTPHGALKLLAPIIARRGQREEERIWERMKHYLETHRGPA